MQDDPHEPVPASGYFLADADPQQARAVEYQLMAAHGWEFLIDNHVCEEQSGTEVIHTAVLGEN